MVVFRYFKYLLLCEIYKYNKGYGEQHFNPKYSNFKITRKYLKQFLVSVSVALFSIFFRTCHRMIAARDKYPQKNELYFDIMESLMAALAATIMTVFSPRFIYSKFEDFSIKQVDYETNRVDDSDYSMI